MAESTSSNQLSVVAIEPYSSTRSGRDSTKFVELEASQLSCAVKDFLSKVSQILSETPSTVSDFYIDQFEVSAQITTEGKVNLLGTGVGTSANGGLKFVFRRIDKVDESTESNIKPEH